jgi:signal transduction histidine kinase
MQSAHLELIREPIHLDSIVKHAVSLLQPSITAREQKAEFAIDESLHPLMIDEQRIERVVANLVSNAHKYSPKGSLIRTEIKRDHDDQVISVIDEGPGINEDEVEAVFSPYYRGKLADTSSVQGSGLGLSIARYLTELHDGTLTVAVDDQQTVGSTFVLNLPAASFDLLDDDSADPQISASEVDEESLWPQAISAPSDRAFTR